MSDERELYEVIDPEEAKRRAFERWHELHSRHNCAHARAEDEAEEERREA